MNTRDHCESGFIKNVLFCQDDHLYLQPYICPDVTMCVCCMGGMAASGVLASASELETAGGLGGQLGGSGPGGHSEGM